MKFKYEEPSIERKNDAIEFINEFIQHNSKINGSNHLQEYLDDYEGWLEKLDKEKNQEVTETDVPKKIFFFVRSDDNKIIGMTNVRTKLNQNYCNFGGNIGYCIRPTERKNGYNKINLYMALKICKEHGIEVALLDVDSDNLPSWKTMEALGARLDCEKKVDYEGHDVIKFYSINVAEALEKYKYVYEQYIE